MKNLENKVAIVTGAGSGIGRAIAILYASEGATVIVSDRTEESASETVAQIAANGDKSVFIKADTSKPAEAESLVAHVLQQYGGLHVACNNAGILGPVMPLGDYPLDGWNEVIGINLSGVFYGMKYQIPAMLKSGGGNIVNISSVFGSVGLPFSCAYVASKHGIIGLTKNAALEYATQNIRVNAIGPGFISTPLLKKNMDDKRIKSLASLHPLGRLGKPSEVAELALWLSSSKSTFVTGSYYIIDGGYTAQ
jgi:NAD(P)-dependent dehydrogenase (short-subunit alcohol dehydrogenase family)